jgi:hypothetical protein
VWATADPSWVLSDQGDCECKRLEAGTMLDWSFPQALSPVLSRESVFNKPLLIDSVPYWGRVLHPKPADWFPVFPSGFMQHFWIHFEGRVRRELEIGTGCPAWGALPLRKGFVVVLHPCGKNYFNTITLLFRITEESWQQKAGWLTVGFVIVY